MKTDLVGIAIFKVWAIIGVLSLLCMFILIVLFIKLFWVLWASTMKNAIKEALVELEWKKEKPTA